MVLKNSIISLALLLIVQCSALAQEFYEGENITSDYVTATVNLHKRKDNTFLATIQDAGREALEVVLSPIAPNSSIFEGDGNYHTWRLEVFSDYTILRKLDETRLVITEMVVAKDKKLLKSKAKELNFDCRYAITIDEPVIKENRGYYIVKNPTSDFHVRNLNKIVFFSEKQIVGSEDLTKVKTTFKIGEPVWAIAYLALPIGSEGYEYLANKYVSEFGRTSYWLRNSMEKIDDEFTFQENIVFGSCPVKPLYKDDLEKNYVEFQVIPTPTSNELAPDESAFISERIVERLGNYSHTIRVSLTDTESLKDEPKLVSGEFTLDVTDGTEMYKAFAAEMANEDLMLKPVPTAIMHDKELEDQMLFHVRALARARGWADITYYEARIVLDWQVIEDNYGLIKGLYVEADMIFKSDEGCGYMNVGFLRDYLGGGEYSDAIHQYTTGQRGLFHCDKLK